MSINPLTSEFVAPNAILIPISVFRCEIAYETSPYRPTAASRTASPANAANSSMLN